MAHKKGNPQKCAHIVHHELTCSCVLALANGLPVTRSTSWGNGDNDGDGCKRGLAEIDGDGLGVRNGPGGDNIPVKKIRNKN